MVIRQNCTDDRRHYNHPTTNEIALVFPDGATELQRDIIVYKRGGGIQQINTWNPAYSSLHYVLLFPYGEHGFQRGIPHRGINPQNQADNAGAENPLEDEDEEDGRGSRTTVSELQFYAYMLFAWEKFKPDGPLPTADSHFSSLLRAHRLLHQYIVDAWAVIDQARLIWFRMNQSTIRAELYRGVVDALHGDEVGCAPQIGQDIGTILPSSYYGGTRQMQECYQDSMAIARHLGPPQLFVTMTANPNWPEIKNELLPGQTVGDRPNLAVRVFELKRRALLKDITKNGVLGRCTAHVHTIEFQKRGLPHMHLLVWLEKASHITTPSDVDELISAELPDPNDDPELYATVTSTMIHGPCGPNFPNTPCWDSEKQACTKGYYPLKPWQEETVMVHNHYVVPYNPYLSRRYDCHINVETCCGICAIKYIFKYVYKGHDRASIELRRRILHGPQPNQGEQQNCPDEIKIQLDSRWVSAYEGLWRIYGCRLHNEEPSIIRLQIHLEGQQMITFQAEDQLQDVVRTRADQDTQLTGFFKLNQHVNPHIRAIANQLLYQEIPNCFSWDKRVKVWKLMKLRAGQQGQPGVRRVQYVGGALGRMYFVGPNGGDRFFLRLLLTVAKGPTSFQDVRTYRGIVYPTDHAACVARGLLEDDQEWATCLREAATFQTGFQLRRLFCVILLNCAPSDPKKLWEDFRQHLCDDLRHFLQRQAWAPADLDEEQVYDYGLYLLQQLIEDGGKTMADVHMNSCQHNWAQLNNQNRLLQEQHQLRLEQPDGIADTLHAQLNQEQLAAFTQVYTSVTEGQGTTFFLDGPAGTGKTFLYKALCYKIRSEEHIVLCVASSGIAALLLPGSRTSHSRFKILIDVHETSTCSISKTSDLGRLIQQTKLIIWDEVPMQNRFCAEAFDRTCRDVCSKLDQPFGGITVVFGGDFRQILPVVPKGTPSDILNVCLKWSPLWPRFHQLMLTQNMRLQGDPEAEQFARWLLDIGEGVTINEGFEASINFPRQMLVDSWDALIAAIYPNLATPGQATDDLLQNSTILDS
ncbi:putative ATP-dependent DNA helicase PIF1 [Rhizoctonia solani 123E]|uniref:ATP-dependent DNA helicase n=1 Tax=Rhizoctonia solani 123E TaxID=1423351 RepID=A0A074S6W8_9AGAM|nr:putative ATP-dependent DNA helicase PIF1 [Rhizoctonia solani 123E]